MDKLGNKISEGDLVVFALGGRVGELMFGYVLSTDFKPQQQRGLSAGTILVNSMNKQMVFPQRNLIVIPDEMQPAKRQEKLHGTEEAVEVSDI